MEKIQKEFYILNGKEYTLEQLDQLRTEYNFLVSDIEEKEKYKSRLEKDMIVCNETIKKERDDFEEEKRKIIFENNKLEKELKDKIKLVDVDIIEKENKNRELLAEIATQQSILDAKQNEIIRDTRLLLKEKEEFDNKTREVLSGIDEREKQLEIDSKKAKEMLIEGKGLIKEYDAKKMMIEGWENEYKQQKDGIAKQSEEINIKWAVIEKQKNQNDVEMVAIDKNMEKNNKLLEDIDIKSRKLEEKLEDLKNREWELAKNITEFRETKYQFLVIMKQKGISKLDIEKLDKEFSI